MNTEQLRQDVKNKMKELSMDYYALTPLTSMHYLVVSAWLAGVMPNNNHLSNEHLAEFAQFVGKSLDDYTEPQPVENLNYPLVHTHQANENLRIVLDYENSRIELILSPTKAGELADEINQRIIEQEFTRLNIPELPQGESLGLFPKEGDGE